MYFVTSQSLIVAQLYQQQYEDTAYTVINQY